MTPTRNFTGSRTLPQGRSIGVNINLPNTCWLQPSDLGEI
jgi:hypothetical protein